MKIKILWGFKSEPGKVAEAENGLVRAGLVTTVDDRYAHDLIGRGLAKAYGDKEAAEERAIMNGASSYGTTDEELSARESALEDGLAALQVREGEIIARETSLTAAHDDLQARVAALDAREAEIGRREEALMTSVEQSTPPDNKDGDGKPGAAPKKTKPAAPAETK